MAVALIDYNMGNLGSVCKALEYCGAEVRVIDRAADLEKFTCCILPGVGHFGDGMEHLRQRCFDQAILHHLNRDGYFFGVCLGMQMLLEESEEAPGVTGLGVLPGAVKRFPEGFAKVPHMGWNGVEFSPGHPLDPAPGGESYFYFVHSYYAPLNPAHTTAVCDYILPFSACVGRGRCHAAQFHPEKSQESGLELLRKFLKFAGEI